MISFTIKSSIFIDHGYKRTGLPLHKGRHLGANSSGSADVLVHDELKILQKKYDNEKVKRSNLIEEIGTIENKVRSALENNTVRLQSADPHWNGKI